MSTAVEFTNVSKSFGLKSVLKNLNFIVPTGTIHGLIGENGAGKSTAMNLLYGLYSPTSGQISIFDKKINFRSPAEALENKIGMVHQHFMLAEALTALENILLHNKNHHPWQSLDRQQWRQKLTKLSQQFGFSIDLDKKIADLSVGEQQRVEILKVLSRDADLIILDEPTAVLTPQEVSEFFINLRNLKELGKTIIIISHKLKEIKNITDNISVLRNGEIVANFKTSDVSVEQLAEEMIGKKPQSHLENRKAPSSQTEIISEKLTSFNFSIKHGEILGVAGVEGNGQTELIHEVLKLKKQTSQKWALFPEDRLRYGVLPKRPLYENLLLGHVSRYSQYGFFINLKKLIQTAKNLISEYDIRPTDPYTTFSSLSGGNQQKVVVAREMQDSPAFILAAHPTRGVDIGAVQFIHEQILSAQHSGAGVLLISSDLEELMTLSDRIAVLYKGKIVATFEKSSFSENKIGLAMGGAL